MDDEDDRDRFLRQALDPTRCFLCGTDVDDPQRSREHVFPGWMQREFSLWDQELTLLNGTPIPYRRLFITCCKDCNTGVLSQLENEVRSAFLAGTDAVRRLDPERLFLWLGKFYYGLLFRDLTLAMDRSDPSLGMLMDPETLREVGLHHLLLRRLKDQVTWNEFPASIFVFEALSSSDKRWNFDYSDSLEQPFITMRCNTTYLAAFLQDFGAARNLDLSGLRQVDAANSLQLHQLQCLELDAIFHTLLKNHRPASTVVSREGDGWRVIAMSRGGLSGRPPFEAWDDDLYVRVLRGQFLNRRGVELTHSGEGIPSLLLDPEGEPFQAPDFDWAPSATTGE
jgi:hypothetical protein